MRAIVTGASGMLGNVVLRELLSRGHDAQGWSLATEKVCDLPLFRQDLTVEAATERAVLDYGPDLIVNCAAMTDVDLCERCPEEAMLLNGLVPGFLAELAKEFGFAFVQISTDAVYDGERPNYHKEDDTTKPLSVYALTKLAGEKKSLSVYPESLVVRTNMFGWTPLGAPRPKFVEEILGALSSWSEIALFEDATFSPLHVQDLAEIVLDLVLKDEPASGIVNVGSWNWTSKYAFGQTIADVFGFKSKSKIRRVSIAGSEFAATRPKNTRLDITRLVRELRWPPSIYDGISRLREEVDDGRAFEIRGRSTYP